MCRGEAERSPRHAVARPRGGLPRVHVGRAVYVQLAGLVLVLVLIGIGTGRPVAVALGHGALAALLALLTLAWHEAGHALTARRAGLRVHAFKVRGLMDGATVRDVAPRPGIDLAVILAGPAASAVLCLVGIVVARATDDPLALARLLAALNLLALVASLTAGARSDGARAWRAFRAHRALRDQRVLAHEQRRMHPVLGVDLHEDRGDLVPDGLLSEAEPPRDLDVRGARAQQPDDLKLTR